jgi:hypothetical protein
MKSVKKNAINRSRLNIYIIYNNVLYVRIY